MGRAAQDQRSTAVAQIEGQSGLLRDRTEQLIRPAAYAGTVERQAGVEPTPIPTPHPTQLGHSLKVAMQVTLTATVSTGRHGMDEYGNVRH